MSTYSTIISYIQAALPNLDSQSVTAMFGKIAEANGQVVDNTITEVSNTQIIITNLITNKNYGHPGWYTDNAKAFQYGDNLSIASDGSFYYAVVDPTKQVIAQAAFNELIGEGGAISLVLKVACIDPGTGLLAPLTLLKFSAFTNYFKNFNIPGLPVTIISNDPNTISFTAAIAYDGTFDLWALQSNVNAALLVFRNTYTFNGEFYNYFLENYLVANVPGVRAVYLSDTFITNPGGSPISFSGSTSLSSGYFNYGTNTLNYATV